MAAEVTVTDNRISPPCARGEGFFMPGYAKLLTPPSAPRWAYDADVYPARRQETRNERRAFDAAANRTLVIGTCFVENRRGPDRDQHHACGA